jgi:hypothetical protein
MSRSGLIFYFAIISPNAWRILHFVFVIVVPQSSYQSDLRHLLSCVA